MPGGVQGPDVERGTQSTKEEALAALALILEDTRKFVHEVMEHTERRIRSEAPEAVAGERELLVCETVLERVKYLVIRLDTATHEKLTPRETEIAKLASHGKHNKAIARELRIKPSTVAAHLRKIYRKLDIEGRSELGWQFAAPKSPLRTSLN